MITIYRFFYFITKQVFRICLPFLNQKMQAWIKLRDSKDYMSFKSNHEEVYLIHAASGEIEYAKAFIRELKKKKPDCQIVVSYSSPSAPKLFNNIIDLVTGFFPLPWDNPNDIQSFLKVIHPTALIFSRTDLWPELIFQAYQLRIPISVVSYNPSLNFLNRLMTDLFYRPIQNFFCVSNEQADELKKILPYSNIIADGDTRFDQVFWRLSQPSLIQLNTDQKIIVWGSTWEEDEKQLTQTLPWLKQQKYQLIWSSHEFNDEKIKAIIKILKENGLSYELFSDFSLKEKNHINLIADVLILDKIGYLADFYRYAHVAFVGGSFKAKVHSVMEPLCCGLPVITGPMVQNNPEALRYAQIKINQLPMVNICQNHKQILESLSKTHELDLFEYKKMAKTQLEKNKGLAEKQVRFIINSIAK